MSMLVLHPKSVIFNAGSLTCAVGVVGGVFVLVNIIVGVSVFIGVGVMDALVTPMITGVGLKIAGVRVGRTKGVGGLLGSG
jgi:hypothetical protein